MSPGLAEQLPADWRAALAPALREPWFEALEQFVAAERARYRVFPPEHQVFAALAHTPLRRVKVVLLGQDPYPTEGNANGLSFSVAPGKRPPASLKNLLQAAALDVGARPPGHGVLDAWAQQGVLLLNAVLTVREGAPGSHQRRGWERFTAAVREQVKARPQGVVFLLLGRHAERLCGEVDLARHAVVRAPHPSPLNARNPITATRPVSAVNQALRERGEAEIDWQLPEG